MHPLARLAVAALPLAAQVLATSQINFDASPLRNTTKTLDTSDALFLTFAQILAQLEATFYQEATAKFNDTDFESAGYVPKVPLQIIASILEHSNNHATHLTSIANTSHYDVPPPCGFTFTSGLLDVKTFISSARLIELISAGVYLDAASRLTDKSLVGAAASILGMKSRHQTALNILAGGTTVPFTYDQPITPSQALALVGPFIHGYDLGIVANTPLMLKNTTEPGSRIEIDTFSLEGNAPFCQILTSGENIATVQPIDDCMIPSSQPDGPIYIFATLTQQPITSDVHMQNATAIVAGPAIGFIDTNVNYISDAIDDVKVRTNIWKFAMPFISYTFDFAFVAGAVTVLVITGLF